MTYEEINDDLCREEGGLLHYIATHKPQPVNDEFSDFISQAFKPPIAGDLMWFRGVKYRFDGSDWIDVCEY